MTHDHFDVILAGNNLTVLVAAAGLAEAGRRVCVVNPLRTWGGHFTRLEVSGQLFDPGAVSHEFTAYNDEGATDVLNYDAARRNDFGRFVGLIEKFTRTHVELVKIRPPQMIVHGAYFPDLIMSNRLESLHHPPLAGRIRAEQRHIAAAASNEWHPRHKKTSDLFLHRSYYDVSIANHGATLHSAVFESLFHKMSARSSTSLIALYHRIAWLPLYYPETLRAQCEGTPQQLPETYFCYPRAGYIGAFADALERRMAAARVTCVREAVSAVEGGQGRCAVVLHGGQRLESPELVWSLAHDDLVCASTGGPREKFEKWSATLVFLTVPPDRLRRVFSVLYAPDDDVVFYRSCNQTDCAGSTDSAARIVVEVNPDYATAQGVTGDDAIVQRVCRDFLHLGLVENTRDITPAGVRTLRDVVLLPDRSNTKLLERQRDVLLTEYPGVRFTRNVDAFFADTLNDQIIKGLKLIEQLDS